MLMIPNASSIASIPSNIIATPPIISISSEYLIANFVAYFPNNSHAITKIKDKINSTIWLT